MRRQPRLRATCTRCGRRGAVCSNGSMWAHQCGDLEYRKPPARDVETFEWRTELFVRELLRGADEARIQAALVDVRRTFAVAHVDDTETS